jgi:predicted ATPase
VENAIGLAIGAGEARPMTTERLTSDIGEKRLVLLLDSFEHVLAASPLLADLLRGCPHLKMLVTSRAPLRISGEQEYPVPTLPVPDPKTQIPVEEMEQVASVRLFVDRATRLTPDFTLTSANAAWVAAICRRLDGLPLALELAAARTKTLPPRELLHRLETTTDAPALRLLGSGPRDAPARHQSLRQTIAWSFGLLNEPDQMLFRRLGIFIGGCTLDAAEAICAPRSVVDDPDASASVLAPSALLDIDEGLASLIDQSLVYRREGPDGEQRFHMLETIGEFAREQLAQSSEEAAMKRRHARYYLTMVESTGALLFASQPKRAASAAEHGNIQAALSWLVRNG